MRKKKQKIILPPDLPPEPTEDEVEVSDEDLEYFTENRVSAGVISSIDIKAVTKHVKRVANVKEDELEALYEKRLRRKQIEKDEDSTIQVDSVDALPVKSLDGKLYYRTVSKTPSAEENKAEAGGLDDAGGLDEAAADKSITRLTKQERRAKLKKDKKEAKKQGKEVIKDEEVVKQRKEVVKDEEVAKTPQTEVLAEVKKELSSEEELERKKCKLAELGIALLADPESNIKLLKEMLQISKDNDTALVKLGLLSLLAVFKDIIPGYRIRLPTEKEQEMIVSKVVKKMRFYESTLLSAYKAYLQKLMALEKRDEYKHVAIRCISTLLEAVPHFNFRESLLASVVRNSGSADDVVRNLCCASIKSLFSNEGKHGGEVTVDAVRMIANYVKVEDCQLHPDLIEVFLSLSFDEDLRKPAAPKKDEKVKWKRNKKRKNVEEPKQVQENDRKKTKKEMLSKTREEVNADFKAASLAPDVAEQKQMQTETLSAVFETYFRILKHTTRPIPAGSESNVMPTAFGSHPLLAPCLIGIGKFAHLLDLDYMGDLMNYLKKLASAGSNSTDSSGTSLKCLTVSERLQCCIVAFKVMRSNLDALNVDLKDFHVQLYNLILEYRPGRDRGELLAEALKLMLCDDRQHDMQRAAAFTKRLAMFACCFGSAESMAALVTLKHLLQKNVKCRNLLENDAGGGSVSGSIAKYLPYATDPNLCGALASVLWEVNLLSKHYHPAISAMASGVSNMNDAQSQVHLSLVSPQQAFSDFSLEKQTFDIKIDSSSLKLKRKRTKVESGATSVGASLNIATDEDGVKKNLSKHFLVHRDISENERLRAELDKTKLSLQLYEQYKKSKKKKKL